MKKNKLVLKNNVKKFRNELGLSQFNLASIIGVSRNTISSIETGQYEPSAKLALVIAIVFDKPFEEVFYFDE